MFFLSTNEKETIDNIIVAGSFGRIVRHWNNFGGYTLQIFNLQAGAYIPGAKNRADGTEAITKFVIGGRRKFFRWYIIVKKSSLEELFFN